MSKNLTGKVALVTGGSRGIGAATVRRLAAEGAQVAFTYSASAAQAQELADEIIAAGGQALAIQADSADAVALQQAVLTAVTAFKQLDILVNNAGIMLRGVVDDFSIADFDRSFAVNVRAVFVATQAAVPHMLSGGRIITIGSVVAERNGFPGISAYSMTKGAVAALNRGLARDLGPRGITANVIQPGPTNTDMTDDSQTRERVKAFIPLNRLGEAEEIASLVAYLSSPEAGFINGAALTVDGGYLA